MMMMRSLSVSRPSCSLAQPYQFNHVPQSISAINLISFCRLQQFHHPSLMLHLTLITSCFFILADVNNLFLWPFFLPFSFLVAKRYKNFRNYVYQYEADTYNTVNGAANIKNGPKVSCKVGLTPRTTPFPHIRPLGHQTRCVSSKINCVDGGVKYSISNSCHLI